MSIFARWAGPSTTKSEHIPPRRGKIEKNRSSDECVLLSSERFWYVPKCCGAWCVCGAWGALVNYGATTGDASFTLILFGNISRNRTDSRQELL